MSRPSCTHRILIGDCLEQLPELDSESVQCCVTSPPYFGLRNYGAEGQVGLEGTPEQYVATITDAFREVKRVLHRDGTLWLNLGDSYAAGGGPPGSAKQASNKGTVDTPVRKAPKGYKPKDLLGIPWRVAFALQADGWYLRSDIIWHKPNVLPSSVTDRPTVDFEHVFLLAKSARYYYDADAIKEPVAEGTKERYEYGFGGNKARALKAGANGRNGRPPMIGKREPYETRNKRSVWSIVNTSSTFAHYAVFPEALVEPCILAGCPEGGTVLDPFAGSGTVAAVAQRLGRNSISIELNRDFRQYIRERLRRAGGEEYTSISRPVRRNASRD